jgi:hypothetical protein
MNVDPQAFTWPFLLNVIDNPIAEWNAQFKQLMMKEP